MIITYFRSSSFSDYIDYCQQKYFITYVLGHQDKANIKAEKGTVTHKVLECLALMKLAIQEGKSYIQDDVLGRYSFVEKDLFLATKVDTAVVALTNKQRSDEKMYLWDCAIASDHTRLGGQVVLDVFTKVYDYYSQRSEHKWSSKDKIDCWNWTWIALDYHNGIYDPRLRTIYQPEQRFDITLEEDWAHYDFDVDGRKIEGQLCLKGTIDLITEVDHNVLEVIDWKGLPLDTELPTPTGWTTMGDVQVGDQLFDKDGKITKVIGKSLIKYKECYKITFDDTSYSVCDNEHLWLLNNNKIVSILDLKINDKIDVTKPLDIPNINLPIDPYLLGIWLGDGRNRSAEICGVDKFIFDEIERRGYKISKNIATGNCPSHTIYGMTKIFRDLNLLHNKHIPNIYLRASYSQRLDLLRGLMDSDGNVNNNRKQCVFTNCNKQLSNDVKELLLSLGQRPLQSNIKKKGFGIIVDCYPISFRPININPFLLPRKANNVNINWGSGRSHVRSIKRIEKINEQFTQCIKVDSPTETFLCTRNMIPTHNTGARKNWGTNEIKSFDKLQEDKQLMLYYFALSKLVPHDVLMTIFYIRDGGPFTMCFDEKTIAKITNILKDTFHDVKKNQEPLLRDFYQKDRNCSWCTYFKNRFDGDKLNICSRVRDDIRSHGMDYVVKTHKNQSHDFHKYQAPGE